MSDKSIELTREVLYQKIWETPMSTLSKELDISDVGLKKLCRRNGIPTPPQGYHLMANQNEKHKLIKRLPPRQDSQHESFRFQMNGEKTQQESKIVDNDSWVMFKEGNVKVAPSKQILEINRVLKAIRKPLHLSKTDERGILRVPKEHPIRVAPDRLESAMEVLRILFVRLSDYGASVPIYDPDASYRKMAVSWLGYEFVIKLDEFSHKVLKPKSEWPDPKSVWHSERDKYYLVPNGKLELSINPPGMGYITAKDGRTLIKDRLDDIIKRMFTAANDQKQKDYVESIRKERAIEYLVGKDEERREREFQRLKQKQLMKESKHWHRVNELILYLAAVEETGPSSGKNTFKSEEDWQVWLLWSKDQLDSIDPLKNGKAGKQPDYPEAKKISSVPSHYLEVDDPEEADEYYRTRTWL
jgi:hypothetical protein